MLLARCVTQGRVQLGVVEAEYFYGIEGGLGSTLRRTGSAWKLSEVKLLSPIEPNRVFVVMGGFRKGRVVDSAAAPWLMPKFVGPVSGDYGQIVVPSSIRGASVEVELAVVVGKEIYAATAEEAREAILGFTCFNDASALEFVEGHDYLRAKSIDTFASMGPWIRTDLTEARIADGLSLVCRVNGKVEAKGTTRELKFAPSEVLRSVSTLITLKPGDVISLGTPKPCGVSAGDSVELEIEGLGVLHNVVTRR